MTFISSLYIPAEASQVSPDHRQLVVAQAYQQAIRGDYRHRDGLAMESVAAYTKALALFGQVGNLGNRDALFVAQVHRKIGAILAEELQSSRWAEAFHHYKRALQIADLHGSQDGLYEAASGICDVSFRLGRLKEAAFYCQFKHTIAWTMSKP